MTSTALNTPVAMDSATTVESRSERGSGDGTDDVGDRAGADGGDADRIGVSKGHGDGGPDDERQDRAQR